MTATTGQPTARQYLAEIPVLWISLDRATDRMRQWYGHCNYLFGGAYRVPAVDASEISVSQIDNHIDATRNAFLRDPNMVKFKYPAPNPTSKVSRRTARVNAAVRLSHLRALSWGIESDFDRFLIAEDDLMPRSSLFNEDIPLPPTDSDISIWSGALPRFNVSQDNARFEAGYPSKWRPIEGDDVWRSFGAELYEVTRETAIFMHEIISKPEHDIAYDHAWSYALCALDGYRLTPRAFAQIGKSYRNHKNRQQTIERRTIND